MTLVMPLPSVIVLSPGDRTGKSTPESVRKEFFDVEPLYASIDSQSTVVYSSAAEMVIVTPFTVTEPVP